MLFGAYSTLLKEFGELRVNLGYRWALELGFGRGINYKHI